MKLCECLRCGRVRPHSARGLCGSCNAIANRNGTLDDFPRATPEWEWLLEEWEFIGGGKGVDPTMFAHRIGKAPSAVCRALHRAVNRGDQRGVHKCPRPEQKQRKAA